jgi:hypothetical protein
MLWQTLVSIDVRFAATYPFFKVADAVRRLINRLEPVVFFLHLEGADCKGNSSLKKRYEFNEAIWTHFSSRSSVKPA